MRLLLAPGQTPLSLKISYLLSQSADLATRKATDMNGRHWLDFMTHRFPLT